MKRADQDRLDDERPGKGAPHHVIAHHGAVRVDLAAEIVAGERQRDQAADRAEVADVAHPVVVGPLLLRRRAHVFDRGVGAADEAAEGDVA